MKAGWNSYKEKLPKFFPWGFVLALATALIILPAYQCPLKKKEITAPDKISSGLLFKNKKEKKTKASPKKRMIIKKPETKVKTTVKKEKKSFFKKRNNQKRKISPPAEEQPAQALNDWTI